MNAHDLNKKGFCFTSTRIWSDEQIQAEANKINELGFEAVICGQRVYAPKEYFIYREKLKQEKRIKKEKRKQEKLANKTQK